MNSSSRLPGAHRLKGRRPLSMLEGPLLAATTNVPSTPRTQEDNNNLIGMESASKKLKRRSLLPQFSRKTSGEEKQLGGAGGKEPVLEVVNDEDLPSSTPGSDEVDRSGHTGTAQSSSGLQARWGRPRPVSMMPTVSGSLSPTKLSSTIDSAQSQMRPDIRPNAATHHARSQTVDISAPRPGSSRLPQTPRVAVPSRTTSIRSSQASVGSAGARLVNGHQRDASTSSRTSPRKTDNTLVRPGSSTAASTSNAADLDTTRMDQSMLPADNSLRKEIARARGLSTTTSIPPASQRGSMLARGRPTSMMIPSTSTKPDFNSYQQHYSPAKSSLPKAPIPSVRTSSVKVASGTNKSVDLETTEISNDFDLVKQQIELLQLSLLHSVANQALEDYTNSAKQQLGQKHAVLEKEYEDVRVSELELQRIANLTALDSWCRDQALLVENLQILSMISSDLGGLAEEGSRYQGLITSFDTWVQEADTPAAAATPMFVKPLAEDWKSVHSSVLLKLRGIQRNLSVLPPAPAEKAKHADQASALVTVLKSCKDLVEGTLRELEIMLQVEEAVLAREKRVIEESARNVLRDDLLQSAAGAEGKTWTPIWQKAAS